MSGMRLLDLPLIRRVRQNHAVEHATITMLMARHRSLPLVGGRSNHRGYYVFGAVETEQLAAAARDALVRLQRGEAELAIHPNCGTNLVTAGVFSGIGALALASGRGRSWWDRAPSAVLGATLALLLAMPAGRWMQENVTTDAGVTGLRIAGVTRHANGPMIRHRVAIEG